MASLRVCVLSDGQAGHYNQSRGMVCALQQFQPVETDWIDVRLRFGLARSLLRWRLNRAPRPAAAGGLLRALCRLGALPREGCDLIVSAGGRTSFANAWLAAALGVPNVYAGSLRGLDASLFSLVLTLEPLPGAPANNLVLPLPPSPLTPQGLRAGEARLRDRLAPGAHRYWTLMLGGDGAGYRYRKGDWLRLPGLMKQLSARHDIRWLLLSSRRTGRAAERALRDALEPGILADSCWFGDGTPCDIEAFLGAAERVLVTEDSMTMLTEAIASLRPVHSLRPARAAPDARFAQAIERFRAQGLLCRHSLEELAHRPESLESQHCRVLEQSPLVQLGAALAQRLDLPRAP